MTPVILLSDASLANGSEPWLIPDLSTIEPIEPCTATPPADGGPFLPFERNERGIRPWAVPGSPGLQHRIGGLEKKDLTGQISYDGANHELMTVLREKKIDRLGETVAAPDLYGGERGDLLLITWGGTFGAVRDAVMVARARGRAVSHLHVRWVNPLRGDIGAIARGFERVIVPELNRGQFARRIRSEYLIDAQSLSRMPGKPFTQRDLEQAIDTYVNNDQPS
ncbi:MAG: 2-oxoglutarate oxidoreductase subunit KorA [Gammaproteobacteria bacterium]|nr:2-oxoglutarate oxidoreductase subunit KorA [Gammaproteobacteria bacterium]